MVKFCERHGARCMGDSRRFHWLRPRCSPPQWSWIRLWNFTISTLCLNFQCTKSGARMIHIHNRPTREFAAGATFQLLNGCAAHASRRLLMLGAETCSLLAQITTMSYNEHVFRPQPKDEVKGRF